MSHFSFLKKSGTRVACLLALATLAGTALSQEPQGETKVNHAPYLARDTETSLIFHEVQVGEGGKQKALKVFIRVKNTGSGTVKWTAAPLGNVKAELLDAEGKPVPSVSEGASLSSATADAILVPYGSTLDWQVSYDRISLMQAKDHSYTLCVGGRTWPVPIATASQYSLHLQVIQKEKYGTSKVEDLMIDVPVTKIRLTPQ